MGNGERLTETICVSLVDVRISERRRQSTNASKVEQYRLWLEQGREAPPVRLARDGVGYVVRDGRHRVLAAIAAGHADIEAVLSAIARMIRRLTRRAERMRRRGLLRARAAPIAAAPPNLGMSGGRTPRLQRGGAGSTPAVSTFASVVSTAARALCTAEVRVRLLPEAPART